MIKPFLVGITGGQGVGKSTFCRKLGAHLRSRQRDPVAVISGLGAELKRRGIPYGSAATADAIATAFSIHIRRELDAPAGITILDRCVIDALAYVRCTRVTSPSLNELYKDLSVARARDLSCIVHLTMTGQFLSSDATHESARLRKCVAEEIPKIIELCGVRAITLNAADRDALSRVDDFIEALLETASL